MLVEHRFLTSMSWPEVAARLGELLATFGLELVSSCAACDHKTTLSSMAQHGTSCPNCGCQIRMLFHNGDKAGSAENLIALRFSYESPMVSMAALLLQPKDPTEQHGELLTSLADGLERSLAQGMPAQLVQHQWLQARRNADEALQEQRLARQTSLIITTSVLLATAVIIIGIFLAAL